MKYLIFGIILGFSTTAPAEDGPMTYDPNALQPLFAPGSPVDAQTTFVRCQTAGGNIIVVQGRTCPPGTIFLEYVF